MLPNGDYYGGIRIDGLLKKIHGLIEDIKKVSKFKQIGRKKKKKNVSVKEKEVKIMKIEWKIKGANEVFNPYLHVSIAT